MQYRKLMPWARKLTVLSVLIALIATVYVSGAATPHEAVASSHVEYVFSDWNVKPSGVRGGDQFRLIFLSSTKRKATSLDIADYNTFVQDLAAGGHNAIRPYADGFNVVGCTASMPGFPAGVNARDNTGTTGTGVPIYWLKGTRVADNYADFYDGSWDDEANIKNESGDNGLNINQSANRPWTGCEHDGTEAFVSGASEGLGENDVDFVRVGRPNSSGTGHGPISSSDYESSSDNRPMYGISPVFEVIDIPTSNTGTLTDGGTPRTGVLISGGAGEHYKVRLAKGLDYQIDVKGSERSQPGGTVDNPRIKMYAGSVHLKLLNRRTSGVSRTLTQSTAIAGGIGQNSRLIVSPKNETRDYYLRIYSASGDNGSYTVTVNNLSGPDGRRAPDIFVDQENRNSVEISWTKAKKTHSSLVAPAGNYKIEYRRLSDTNWTSSGIVDKSDRAGTISSLAANTAYEVRVRMIPPANSTHTYRWGYARVYTTN